MWKKKETIQHISAAREQLAPTECVKRHVRLAKLIHKKLAEAAEFIEEKSPYYKCTTANVLESENFKLYWNRSILTDKIPSNRLNITFMNKKTKNTFLIDIAVPNTHNLAKTITDKQNKYQGLANDIIMCYVEAKGSKTDPDSNIIYGSNSKVTNTESNKT